MLSDSNQGSALSGHSDSNQGSIETLASEICTRSDFEQLSNGEKKLKLQRLAAIT